MAAIATIAVHTHDPKHGYLGGDATFADGRKVRFNQRGSRSLEVRTTGWPSAKVTAKGRLAALVEALPSAIAAHAKEQRKLARKRRAEERAEQAAHEAWWAAEDARWAAIEEEERREALTDDECEAEEREALRSAIGSAMDDLLALAA